MLVALRTLAGLTRSLPSWWHLWSLDAPTVALVWCLAFARAAGVCLPWSTPLVLALSTWVAYFGDRLLDARFAHDPSRLRERHVFCAELLRRRRGLPALALALAALACVVLGALLLPRALFFGYAAVSAASLVYFAAVHLGGASAERFLPKEAAVGVIFAVGTALPAWLGAARRAREGIAPMVAVFAALCWLNCVAIERWEATWYSADGETGGHLGTRRAARALGSLLVSLVVSVPVAAYFAGARPAAVLAPPLALAALVLLAVDQRRASLHARVSRVLADAALLTPLPWLAALAMRR